MSITVRQFGSMVIRNTRGQVLLVRESRLQTQGRFNLPGGHVEEGETPVQCAIRETLEETGLRVRPEWLLGEYEFHAGINLVYLADGVEAAAPSRAELAWSWHSLEEIRQIPDETILNPKKLRTILNDLELCKQRPL